MGPHTCRLWFNWFPSKEGWPSSMGPNAWSTCYYIYSPPPPNGTIWLNTIIATYPKKGRSVLTPITEGII